MHSNVVAPDFDWSFVHILTLGVELRIISQSKKMHRN